MSSSIPKFVREKACFCMYGKTVRLESFEYTSRTSQKREVDDFLLFDATDRPAIVLALTSDEEVIALRHFRYATRSKLLELPGGTEPNMSEIDAAGQELRDETGYCPKRIAPVSGDCASIFFDPASFKVAFVPILATGCSKAGEPVRKDNEFFDVELIPKLDWLQMIMDGNIQDAKSIATTMLALPQLRVEFRGGKWVSATD